MTEVAFSSSFKLVFKKRIKGKSKLEAKFWGRVEVFTQNPYEEKLRTHKLSGKLKELWSFSIEYDVRVVFYFVSDKKAVFIDIGKHDEVY